MEMALEDDITAIDNLLQQIQESQVYRIDGTVLSTALLLIYQCGLQLTEAPEIRINDLNYNDNSELYSLTITGSTPIPFPAEVKRRLQGYLTYLSDKGYPAIPRSPLFPKYNDTKKIVRHLEKFSKAIGIKEIRKVGIKRHHYLMKEQGLRDDAAIRSTANQFRMKERSVGQVINDNIQPAGRPKPTAGAIEQDNLIAHIAKAEGLTSRHDPKALIIEFYEFIDKSSFHENDIIGFKTIFIKALLESMNRLEKEAINKELQKNIEHKSFIELLSSIPSAESEGKSQSAILENYYFPERDIERQLIEKQEEEKTDHLTPDDEG
jgi:hypothetical protein